jgi:hypothetical protein
VSPRRARLSFLMLSACTATVTRRVEPETRAWGPAVHAARDSTNVPAPPSAVDQFLVETRTGQLVLGSMDSEAVRVLASNAQRSLYDERLELVWFDTGDRLWVLDLRVPGASPRLIAEHVPPHSEFHVMRALRVLEPADSCDTVPVILLHWNAQPRFEGFYATAPQMTQDAKTWLLAELGRPERGLARQLVFDAANPDVALPDSLLKCEVPSACGATLPFGLRAWQLVLVEAAVGADCWHYACLLRDVQTGAFATPPEPSRWSTAVETERGSCGRYLFNHDQTAFLIGDQLCAPHRPCRKLPGQALGWRVPGLAVGAPE